jgi:hypothetical protein
MAIVDKNSCVDPTGTGSGTLPMAVNPFTGLQFHFGMLLGVDDLDVGQGYPRGKVRLHNAWLHRAGVVWGMGVSFNARRELEVEPGLALDGAGRELHLDVPACLDVGRWYGKHRDDADFTFTTAADGSVTFSARVVVRFRACLQRQVPAIADPCEGASSETAYSRVYETVELLLRPIPAAGSDKPAPYHRLRVLFGLEPADASARDQAVVARRNAILALAQDARPPAFLEALRDFAALDEIDLRPAAEADGTSELFPDDEATAEVALADLVAITVKPVGTDFAIADPLPGPPDGLDVTVRPSHIATRTIQELLVAGLCCVTAAGDGGGGGGTTTDTDAGGPRVVGDPTLAANRKSITFTTDKPLSDGSTGPEAFSVTGFTAGDGWSDVDIKRVTVNSATNVVTIELKERAEGLVRLIVYGTGPKPVLGAGPTPVPLAGAVGGPPGTANEGHDFIFSFVS